MRRARAVVVELVGLFVSDWIDAGITLVLVVIALVAAGRHHDGAIGFGLAGALSVQLLVSAARSGRPSRG